MENPLKSIHVFAPKPGKANEISKEHRTVLQIRENSKTIYQELMKTNGNHKQIIETDKNINENGWTSEKIH